MSWQLPDALFYGSFTIAQHSAPHRSGNLAFNSIRAYKLPNGMQIDYSLVSAYYIRYLNDYKVLHAGKSKKAYVNKHYEFIGATTLKIAAYLENRLNGKNYPVHQQNKALTQRSMQNLEQRRLVHLRSLSTYGVAV